MAKNILDAFMEDQSVAKVDASKKIRVGIIGTGWIAEAHMWSYMKQPDVEVVAGCDIVPGKAKAFFEKFGVEAKCDYKDDVEMLADKSLKLDAVSICTYNRQHAPCAIHALEAGVNVMLEKPFTVTTEAYADRLFFATDMVNTDMVFPLGSWLDDQLAAGRLSRRAYDLICFENAQRVFGL